MNIKEIQIIAPHFKKRLSGITSTVIQLIPKQRELGDKIAVFGPGLPGNLEHMRWWQIFLLWKKPENSHTRIWHARRNTEMLAGIFLRNIFRMPLKLLFTSAAQRNHSGYTKWLIKKMDKVVATSAKSGSYLQVPYQVIMHGIDTTAFHPPKDNKEKSPPENLGGKFLIGCTGRVRHQKGTDLFVESLIELLPKYPDWTAVITGRITPEHKNFADNLKKKIKDGGLEKRIYFLGEVDDIKQWQRRMSLLVAPSRNEGFGLTPLEAMASGAAVVTSDAGAYAEMVIVGKTGFVAPAGDQDALTKAIETYLANPNLAKEHGEQGVRHVRKNFPLEKEAAALRQVYEKLMEN